MAPKSKLYTKTGDRGTTRLVDGSTVPKHSPRVEAYGTVDELNSHLGEAVARVQRDPRLADLQSPLRSIQNVLFSIGSLFACEDPKIFQKLPGVDDVHIGTIEAAIDTFDGVLPPLTNFILPGGHEAAAALHVARTVCRRAERLCAHIGTGQPQYAPSLIYLNRLSDFLFAAARWCNWKTQQPDILWEKS